MSALERGGARVTGRPEELLRALLPFLSVLLLVVIDLAPLPSAAPTAIAPFLTPAGIYFWLVHRPDLLGNTAILALLLVLDATAGLPLGLTALAFFATRFLLLTPRQFLAGRSFIVIWACFGLAAILLMALRWLIAALYFQHVFAFRPTLFEMLLTIAAYPVVSLLLTRLQASLPRMSHAAPRG